MITAALRQFGANLVDLVRTRIELATIELQEGTHRLFGYLAWAAAAAVLGLFTLALAVLFVLVLFWDTHRLAAVGGMTVLFALGCLVAVTKLRAGLAARPPFLPATLGELRKDAAALKGETEHGV
ncbi:phage holin family protein [Massilia sp. G4R7]|uniref:Phage holin family protein n=1 Tax=Massilia phyllostachyos TaxID=2898585 RepID=A0ABS8Q8R5_9BURK|nr:phage holin family protein [Massilia phyllostachyos]MCD2518156.1 phage holin family protein [Massilia phyllostachyos]